MQTANDLLRELIDPVPTDLVAYFQETADGSLNGRESPRINLLSIADAVRWTDDFLGFHPLVQMLGGVVLDDPNTSNHHIYLTVAPCKGAILYLDHDGDSRIVFPTLSDFLVAARKAKASNCAVDSYHPDGGIWLHDQSGLSRLISELYEKPPSSEAIDVLIPLIPSMDLTDTNLLERLAADEYFILAEAIGDAIALRPRINLERLASHCSEHPHQQASRAGIRALAAIRSLK